VIGARGEAAALRAAVAAVAGVTAVAATPGDDHVTLEVTLADGIELDASIERVVSALVQAGAGVRNVASARASLEEVFAELTQAETSAT
jgi:hypothetical protein